MLQILGGLLAPVLDRAMARSNPELLKNQRRQEYVDRHGSPSYRWQPGALASSGAETIAIETQFVGAQKYAPLDTTRIINNSGERLQININGANRVEIVPSGVITTMREQSVITITITNLSATASLEGEIQVFFSREPLSRDELARRYGR